MEFQIHTAKRGRFKGVFAMIRRQINLLVFVSLLANVGLGLWARHLSKSLSPALEREGTSARPLKATNSKGEAVLIDYSATVQPTVLYVLGPHCVWCARNEESIRFLAAKYSGTHRFIGISTSRDGIRGLEGKYPFPIYTVAAEELAPYGVQGTPSTFVVDPSGVVKKGWTGAYQDDTRKDVEAWFRTKLPALPALVSAPGGGAATPIDSK